MPTAYCLKPYCKFFYFFYIVVGNSSGLVSEFMRAVFVFTRTQYTLRRGEKLKNPMNYTLKKKKKKQQQKGSKP